MLEQWHSAGVQLAPLNLPIGANHDPQGSVKRSQPGIHQPIFREHEGYVKIHNGRKGFRAGLGRCHSRLRPYGSSCCTNGAAFYALWMVPRSYRKWFLGIRGSYLTI
jgi:hypothetical protein